MFSYMAHIHIKLALASAQFVTIHNYKLYGYEVSIFFTFQHV